MDAWIECLKDGMKSVMPKNLESGGFKLKDIGMRKILFDIVCDKACLNSQSKDVVIILIYLAMIFPI